MILSNRDILEEISKGNIKIEPFDEKSLGPASYDLTLSNTFWFFKPDIKEIDIKKNWGEYVNKIKSKEIILKPKEMCLGITKERIFLANHIAAKLEGRSRFARLGLSVHITSSFVQPGVNNHQVLEIVNNSNYNMILREGVKISQIIFYYLKSPTTKPYKKVGTIAINQ